jgi:flagellar M-ring protein FliF
MSERLKAICNRLPDHIKFLPPAKLFGLLGILAGFVAVGLVSLLWMSGGGDQQVLYSQLSLEDAAAVTAKLREMQIPYTIGDNGTTVLVPSQLVYDTRLRLASEGLPQGGGHGFELFDQTSFGMTEFMQKLNYQRALQGELSRTITQLAAVHSARVHIVLPEKSLFLEQQDKPTASVVLKLAAGRKLTPEQVKGIAHLVGSSVEGLAPGNVTIVDTTGKILNNEEQNPAPLSQTEAQLEFQQNIEQNLEQRVQSLLESAVGKGKVRVRVSAAIDFQHIERTEERFDADNPVVRSKQSSKEQGNNGLWIGGVPGVRSNTKTANNNIEKGNGDALRLRESETVNYEISKVTSTIVAPSGAIKQLSVAVLVDGSYKQSDQHSEKVYVQRTQAELSKYREIVKGAIGYDESRGDRIEVANMPFEPQENPDPLNESMAEKWAIWLSLAPYAAYIVLGLLLILFMGSPLVKWIINGSEPNSIGNQLPRTIQELEADMGISGYLPEVQEKVEISAPFTGSLTLPELRTQMSEFFRSEPEQAVELLRTWMRE